MTETSVVVSRVGHLGRLHLNRPNALNSLTLEMVRLLQAGLSEFEDDGDIASVLISGEGARALCAGGDIIALFNAADGNEAEAITFWTEEYDLNARIASYPKPYIAFMDGITMGGGVGVSVHGSHRVVTERTKFAMPEAGIGLFPDVGGTWVLGRQSPGEMGTYIGLTGDVLEAGDAISAGLADSYMSSESLPKLVSALAASADRAAVTRSIYAFSEVSPPSVIDQNRAEIDATFAQDTVEEIIAALTSLNTDFAKATLTTLAQKSPTSLKMTLALLRAGRGSCNLRQCLDRELGAVIQMFRQPDFREGIRAAVIDKDRNPQWAPKELAEVSAPEFES
ncbi:UNVERIFIED_CONTAM: hypothetical protein GTU68_043235 [Idotea baltica]|nr:hypothetical protein [Idotea baltica]